jgi:hypothetical protein
MKVNGVRSVAKYGVALIAGLFAALPDAAAQSCAMCYQNAAASGVQGRSALQHGILVLFVPAITIFGGILLLLYSRRHVSSQSAGLAQGPSEGETAGRQRTVPGHKVMLRP